MSSNSSDQAMVSVRTQERNVQALFDSLPEGLTSQGRFDMAQKFVKVLKKGIAPARSAAGITLKVWYAAKSNGGVVKE